jgi:hypothetical protein
MPATSSAKARPSPLARPEFRTVPVSPLAPFELVDQRLPHQARCTSPNVVMSVGQRLA